MLKATPSAQIVMMSFDEVRPAETCRRPPPRIPARPRHP